MGESSSTGNNGTFFSMYKKINWDHFESEALHKNTASVMMGVSLW